jgi:long-chain fatty acid transport protein
MVKVGERMDLGLTLFSPSTRGYTVTGNPSGPPAFGLEPGTWDSDGDFFLIPHFAYNWMLNADSSIGLTIYGNGGMNTEYPTTNRTFPPISPSCTEPGVYYCGKTGVNLEQLFTNVSYSRKINAQHSWGVSAILGYQRFKAEGLGSFGDFGFSSDPTKLTNNGTDTSTGFGAKIGWLGEVSPGVSLAASYQTKMSMSEFDDYKGLFAEQGDFDIPASWTLGLAWKVTQTGTLTFDVQGIQYSDVKSIANPLLPNLGPPGTQGLGTNDGAGFGWEDIVIYKLGYQWETSPTWTWRVGASLGENPIPESEMLFNIIAPGVMETHITGGFTYTMGTNNEFNFAAMYAPENKIKGPNTLEVPGQQQIELYMTQWELTASWGWKF